MKFLVINLEKNGIKDLNKEKFKILKKETSEDVKGENTSYACGQK